MLFFCFVSVAFIQAQTVTGTVTDANGEPLIGVSVVVKGTTVGQMTDIDGKYSIVVDNQKSTLVFSLMGFAKQEISVGSQTVINVKLQEDSKLLDEVVVIGFQTQKKVNLTGAISSVGSDVLENRPVANIGQALQGVVPNLNISISNGAPNSVPSFNVRGGTTLEYDTDDKKYVMRSGAPLILVDGIEVSQSQLNQMNPNDIDNISVLKDASAAAIYGTRATYGVMLVQTKSGKFNQKARISYNYDVSWDKPAAIPDIMDSYTILKAEQDKAVWTGGTISSDSQKKLDAMLKYKLDPRPENAYIMNGSEVWWVASTNPYKELVKDWTPMQKHNVSISGGTDKISYYLSLGAQNQDGMYKVNTDQFRRYNTLLSLNAKVSKWFNIGAKATYNMSKYKTPIIPGGKGNLWAVMKNQDVSRNINMPVFTGPDDPVPNYVTENVIGYLHGGANSKSTTTTTILSLSPEFIIIPGELKLKGDFSFTPTTYEMQQVVPSQKRIFTSWESFNQDHTQYNTADLNRNSSNNYIINVYGEYIKTFATKHNLNAMLGLNQERYKYTSLNGTLNRLFSPNVVNPNAVEDVTLNRISNSATERTGRAVFGSVKYNFDERYHLSIDGRYDGSSKFPKADRFQFFPTFSGAWRISEEKFMETTRSWLDNLKLRGSWGRLGNQPSSDYPYQAKMSTNPAYYLFGSAYPSTVNPPGLVSPSLTFEKATTVNLGVDITMLKNKLDFSFEVYERRVTDVLTDGVASYPAVLGATAPLENSGEFKANGWELTLKWRDRLSNGLRYDVGLVLSDYKNKIVHYAGNPDKTIGNLYDGQNVGEIWGYETGGILQESDFAGKNPNGTYIFYGPDHSSVTSTLWPGFMWYNDLDGDGRISTGTNTVDNPGDRKIIGNSTPRYRYGITANVSYKGFDLNLFFQGVGKRDLWIGNSSYWGGGAGTWWMYERSWTPERTDAKYPMYTSGVQAQTGYLFDASYFRLKQAVLGYTLPESLTKKIGIDRLRFNISGYNLFEITDIPNGFDPDQVSDAYPQKRTIALGVQIGF